MEQHGVGYSSSGLVAQMRDNNNTWQEGQVSVKLAKAYGYCWGVERAVRMAYEARQVRHLPWGSSRCAGWGSHVADLLITPLQAFPNRKVHITNEIIHNPEVNQVRPP
jgi:4-hydroxy-3-methylbut-2-enyl diphosphate reductase